MICIHDRMKNGRCCDCGWNIAPPANKWGLSHFVFVRRYVRWWMGARWFVRRHDFRYLAEWARCWYFEQEPCICETPEDCAAEDASNAW